MHHFFGISQANNSPSPVIGLQKVYYAGRKVKPLLLLIYTILISHYADLLSRKSEPGFVIISLILLLCNVRLLLFRLGLIFFYERNGRVVVMTTSRCTT